jgi:putative transposase
MALMTRFASIDADVARGLALRMDNGTKYLSDHFQNQIKYWASYQASRS